MHNHYFETIEPVFYFEKIGISLSNTYIGRMRAFDNVYVGRNSQPEDVFHLLVGGDFVVGADGKVREIAMWHPKPLLEKTYGPLPKASDVFERLATQGIAKRVPEPTGKTDYASCRNNMPQLPENHFRLRYDAKSTTLESLEDTAILMTEAASGLGLQIAVRDFHLDRRAVLQVIKATPTKRELVFEANLLENGELFVKPSETFFDCPAFVDALRGLPSVKQTHVYGNAFWTKSASFLQEDAFLEQVEIGLEKAAGLPPVSPAASLRR
ncbi:hypothetical protein O9X98_08095 [Agrobacterium salinitolerans]|nr:hypothetical protein [Agrobacterium salinitolerans]